MGVDTRFVALLAAILAPVPCGQAIAQLAENGHGKALVVSPREGGLRRWQVADDAGVASLVAPGSSVSEEHFPKSTVLTNFGCFDEAGDVWCEVQPLHGGPRGYVGARHLTPVAGPDGVIARGINDTAKRAKRKRFDVTSDIPCAQERGQTLAPCPIGVSRSQGGDATAAVTFPSGFTRLLFFMHGEFISAAATMSGAGRDTDWELVGGVHRIRADDQRFEIPDALLFGE